MLFTKICAGIFCVLIFWFWLPNTTIAEWLLEADPHFVSLDISYGLPTNRIEAIVQDRLRYVWIVAANGLVGHYEHELEVLRHNPLDSESLLTNNMQAIHAADNGSIWVAISGQGVFEICGLEIVRQWFTTADNGSLQKDFVWSIDQDCENNIRIMFATSGLTRLATETDEIQYFPDCRLSIVFSTF